MGPQAPYFLGAGFQLGDGKGVWGLARATHLPQRGCPSDVSPSAKETEEEGREEQGEW